LNARRVALVVAALAVLAVAPWIGAPLEGAQGDFILWRLRIPRTIVGALTGGTLALVGAVFQIVFSNPLATPCTVGTTAGATLGTLLAVVLGLRSNAISIIVLAAFLGALAASLLISAIALSSRARRDDVLLAGIAISLAATAISAGLQYAADMRALFAVTQWSLGNLAQVDYDGVLLLLPVTLVCAAVLFGLTRALHTFSVGEDLARSRGVHVPLLRGLALGAGSLGVAAVVAWCGPIAFVGLVVPHLVRRTAGESVRALLPLSLIAGAGFLVVCDLVARVALPGRELPVGMITCAIGAPALVVLVARRRAPGRGG